MDIFWRKMPIHRPPVSKPEDDPVRAIYEEQLAASTVAFVRKKNDFSEADERKLGEDAEKGVSACQGRAAFDWAYIHLRISWHRQDDHDNGQDPILVYQFLGWLRLRLRVRVRIRVREVWELRGVSGIGNWPCLGWVYVLHASCGSLTSRDPDLSNIATHARCI